LRFKLQNKPKQTPAYRTCTDSDSPANLKKKIADETSDILEPIFTGQENVAETPSSKTVEKIPQGEPVISKEKIETPAEPAPRRKLTRNGVSGNTPSIKKALRGEFEDEKKLSAKEQHEIYSKADEEETFTQEQLAEKWNQFLVRLEDRPSIKATLSNPPKLQEDYSLLLEIDNRIQDDMLVDVRPELVSFLRKELRNSKINLKTVVTDIVREKVIYSDIEKYQAMASKNPNLALLKQKLNLDF